MFYFKIFNIEVILISIFLENSKSQYTEHISDLQPDIPSSSLTGAYRPAEIQLSYNVTSRNRNCHNNFAKYLVSIRRKENDDNFGQTHFCGGVIIQSNLILTAAHCLISNKKIMSPSDIKVVAKTPVRLIKTPDSQVIRVRKIIVHEKFSNSGHNFDIALLRLSKHIKLDNNCAAVIALPKHVINDSTSCTVLGWGKLFLFGPLANEVLQLNVTLHSKKFCEIFLLGVGKSSVCASDRLDYEKNPCSGDSGGPLICEDILTGLVSYGFQCGHGFPTVYTDVFEYMSWIRENNANKLQIFNAFCGSILFIVTFKF